MRLIIAVKYNENRKIDFKSRKMAIFTKIRSYDNYRPPTKFEKNAKNKILQSGPFLLQFVASSVYYL